MDKNIKITRRDIDLYKREILEESVLIRLDEAAKIMAVSRSTVLRRVDEGKLVPYCDNSTRKGLRFLAKDLQDYVRQMRLDLND